MSYPEIKTLPLNPFLEGFSRVDMNIPYSDRSGCTLDILLPWANQHQDVLGEVKYPLVVFVQGSAWTSPDRNAQIPQLSELSRKGYVVATVGHRSCLDGCQAPAFLVDVKTAIRFLRAHAKDYSIDPERVVKNCVLRSPVRLKPLTVLPSAGKSTSSAVIKAGKKFCICFFISPKNARAKCRYFSV